MVVKEPVVPFSRVLSPTLKVIDMPALTLSFEFRVVEQLKTQSPTSSAGIGSGVQVEAEQDGLSVLMLTISTLSVNILCILKVIVSSPADVVNSLQNNPEPVDIVHFSGKNCSGFKVPKYAKAPIAIRTTRMAQP